MQTFKLSDMVKGWFVGNFAPTALATDAAEVAVKTYAAGDREGRHVHRIAHEITLVLSGRVVMNDVTHEAGTIVVLEPAA